MKRNLFGVFGVFLFSALVVTASGISYVIGLSRGRAISSKNETSGFKESLEAQEPKYKIASFCVDKNCSAEVEWRFGDDGRTALVRVYDESAASSFSSIKIVKNFCGEGKDAVLVETMSTGCGSGYSASLNFLKAETHNGKFFYHLVSGPRFGELDSYKIVEGREILVAKAVWAPDESHFEPHRYRLEKYVWDPLGEKFIKKDLGTTKGKYSGSIEEIIAAEPAVLEK